MDKEFYRQSMLNDQKLAAAARVDINIIAYDLMKD